MSKNAIATIAAYVDPPYVESCLFQSNTFRHGCGVEPDFLHTALRWRGYQARFLRTWSAEDMLEAVRDGRANMTGVSQTLGGDLWSDLIPFVLAVEDRYVLVTRWFSEQEVGRFVMIGIFKPSLWLTLVFLGLLVLGFIALHEANLFSYFMKDFARHLLTVWCLVWAILVGCYENLLAIKLACRDFESVTDFNSFPEFIELYSRNQCSLIMPPVFDHTDVLKAISMIEFRNPDLASTFRTALQTYPPQLTKTYEGMMVQMVSETSRRSKCQAIFVYDSYVPILKSYHPDIKSVTDSRLILRTKFAFHANSINNFPADFQSYLMTDKMISLYYVILSHYQRKKLSVSAPFLDNSVEGRPLSLLQLQESLVVLTIGLISSVMILFLEILSQKYFRRYITCWCF